jgi:gamma-glutamyltranspeptidase / glutathione hydrolase
MEPFNSRRAAAHARSVMVASSQALAAQVGLQVLNDGGNAVDAAIAGAAVVNIIEPMMNGLGGDAFVLVHWQGKLYGLNASGRCDCYCSGELGRKIVSASDAGGGY